jgi:signal transduction histidine kinase/ActR/RegA family two-component response regulator
VDYILAPVVPEVLRSKVSVFVELARKSKQVQRQSESIRRRATQLQQLTAASLAINGALSVEKMLQVVTDTARDVIGTHQAITLFILEQSSERRGSRTHAVSSFSDKYAAWRDRRLELDAIAQTTVAQGKKPARLTEQELQDHADWEIVKNATIPPVVGGMLAAPLASRSGTNMGVIYLADRYEGQFTNDDESILVQLAQMASIAIENAMFAEEREANRIKDEFLSTLSHELRTPLNAILGWTQLLGMEPLEGEAAHGLSVIERNARAQAKLIEDLLDVSRINTGKLRLVCKPLKLSSVCTAAIEAVRPVADERGVSLIWDWSGGDDSATGDADRLQQVVWNLLSNAVKFTPSGGRVEVRLDRVNGHLRLAVVDSGQGISPSFLPFVFDRFRQGDSTSTRSHGGLGIGLTIVRHIVELHGGTVSAESPGISRGSTFTVTLPPNVPALAAPGHDTDAGYADAAAEAPTLQKSSDALARVRVLVVDDEPDARDVIRRTLTRCGAEVTTVESVDAALHHLQNGGGSTIDIIVSDIAMPDRDGYDLLRALRELNARLAEIPAVALTAYASDEDRARSLSAGFKAHLSKPIEPTELVETVARVAVGKTAAVS